MRGLLSPGGLWPKASVVRFRAVSFVLLAVICIRAATLEVGDLIDPTETRYATIAENMLFSGDWITPRLQTESGLAPYLSKPPLHFWLTALSYKLFGIDEWTSRLPSFMALLLIVASILVFSRRFLSKEVGYNAAIICITSPLMFFLGGSSTVDVTFAAYITAALTAFAVTADKKEKQESTLLSGLLLFCFSAFALLTKGPAGPVLIGIPILFLCLWDRSLNSLRALPWTVGIIAFLSISLPWFYLVEQQTPGSVWYFLFHENFLRFLVEDYGGRHGAAHIRPYGSIWWMFALAMLPWSLFVLKEILSLLGITGASRRPALDRWSFFTLAAGLSPLLVFTVARSILPAYILPAVPGLALFLAFRQQGAIAEQSATTENFQKQEMASLWQRMRYPSTAMIGIALTTIMFSGLLLSAPAIGAYKSASQLLALIADRTKKDNPVVGVIATNNYSPFWTSGAHQKELSNPVKVVYASISDVKNSKLRNLIVRENHGSDFVAIHGKQYEKVISKGKWSWYRRRSQKLSKAGELINGANQLIEHLAHKSLNLR